MSSYSNVIGHQSMVYDDVRNEAYSTALATVLRPDSVVLDIGAGLGIHGLMAAACGARHVYLVDPSPALSVAEKVVAQNGLASKITCIQKPVEQADLPERADVIVSVFTGNFLLQEDLLPSLFYARDLYLKDSGSMLPDCAEMQIAPVSAPEYYLEHVDCWLRPSHDVDFRPVRSFAVNSLHFDAADRRAEEFLTSAATLACIDFTNAVKAECSNSVEFRIEKDGNCHGFVGWFRARLAGQWFSTAPDQKPMHWSQAFLPLNTPLKVKCGDSVTLQVVRPQFGDWCWICTHEGVTQTQSTFYSRALTIDQLRRSSMDYAAGLNLQGRLTRFVLGLMTGSNTGRNIANQAREKFGAEFSSAEELVKQVQSIIRSFGK